MRTDHKSLLHLKEQRISNKIQQKAIFKLMDLQFKIVYKQGSTNVAADALSRNPGCDNVFVVSFANFDSLDRIKKGYHDDPDVVKLMDPHKASAPLLNGFSLTDGLIRQHGRLWLGNNSMAKQHIMTFVLWCGRSFWVFTHISYN